jgi:hypothetical protein
LSTADERCTAGAAELGFRTFYENIEGDKLQNKKIGVVDQQMGFEAGTAPDGSRYYLIEKPNGFAYVMTDTIAVGDAYTNVKVTGAYFLKDTDYGRDDLLRIWATNDDETDILITDMEDLDKVRNMPSWPRSWANFSLF